MSVKIERDTVRKTTEIAEHAGRELAHTGRELAQHGSRELAQHGSRELAQHGRDLAHQRDLPLPGTSGKHPIAEKIGTAITGGKANAGTKGYLMVRRVAFLPSRRKPRG